MPEVEKVDLQIQHLKKKHGSKPDRYEVFLVVIYDEDGNMDVVPFENFESKSFGMKLKTQTVIH